MGQKMNSRRFLETRRPRGQKAARTGIVNRHMSTPRRRNRSMRKTTICLLILSLCSAAGSFGQTHQTNPAAENSYPIIVARVKLPNQTAPTGGTLVTPKDDKVYHVSAYITGASSSVAQLTIFWTDEYGNQSAQPQCALCNNGPYWLDLTVKAVTGTALKYSATGNGGAYGVYVVVEQLE
jgi:hypothetical protein